MCEVLKLKSIYELLNNEDGKSESFFIPFYQRGYRWSEQKVEELLEDSWEFASKKKKDEDEFYCLQPIVVKKNKEDISKWDVIDGQQRLTTVYIILKYLEKESKEYFYIDNFYTLNYETRPKSAEFLEEKLLQINVSNIDFFHMSKTYNTIKEWFKKNKIHKIDFLNVLLKHKF